MGRIELPEVPPTGEFLEDYSSTGRLRPWVARRTEAMLLADSYHRLGYDRRAHRVQECGTLLRFAECAAGHRRLRHAQFCKARLCPMCSWRRSLKIGHQVRSIAHVITARQPVAWILLTLTVRNVAAEDCSNAIDSLMAGWNRMAQRVAFRRAVLGWFRGLEVTHNVATGEMHPHFHALLAVSPEYFTGAYITQRGWRQLWRSAARLSYDPWVDVRAVRPGGPTGQDVGSAVAEVAKYPLKPGSYLLPDNPTATDAAVRVLDDALAHRRLTALGGLLAEVARELDLEDAEDGDLVHIDGESEGCRCSVCGGALSEHLFRWHFGYRQYIG